MLCGGFQAHHAHEDLPARNSITIFRFVKGLRWSFSTAEPWSKWQDLRMRETMTLRIVKNPVQLPIRDCERLGLISKSQAQRIARNFRSVKGQKLYKSHCSYSVTVADVKVPNGNSMRTYWVFRIVGSGPRSQAKNRPIGSGYSSSLPPMLSSLHPMF